MTQPGYLLIQGDANRIPLEDKSVDIVIGSPPYTDCRTYGISAQRKTQEWVSWMLDVSREALRVSRGPVIWIVSGPTRDWNYQPAAEGLMWEWHKLGGECHQFRPVYWNRVGIPGSGGKQWYRGDIEYCLCFKRPGPLPHGNPKANGHAPKYAPGGKMSHRVSDGRRVYEKKMVWPSGNKESRGYIPPPIANPGNLLEVKVGGGHMGHPHAHKNEAPFPEGVPIFFLKGHCPPGGVALDPFVGSGTVLDAAAQLGMTGIGIDLRMSQCILSRDRMESPELRGKHPVKSSSKKNVDAQEYPLLAAIERRREAS